MWAYIPWKLTLLTTDPLLFGILVNLLDKADGFLVTFDAVAVIELTHTRKLPKTTYNCYKLPQK
jgi:hypothetical protein